MAPAVQKPLVGDFSRPAVNPQDHSKSKSNNDNPSVDHHRPHHYKSPFQQVDMSSPCAPQPPVVIPDLPSRQPATALIGWSLGGGGGGPYHLHLGHPLTALSPPVLMVLMAVCALALSGLLVSFLCCGARGSLVWGGRRAREGRRWRGCFDDSGGYDDDDDDGLADEKRDGGGDGGDGGAPPAEKASDRTEPPLPCWTGSPEAADEGRGRSSSSTSGVRTADRGPGPDTTQYFMLWNRS